MEDDVVKALRHIVQVAQDETYTSSEALDVIMAVAEDLLALYGHSLNPEEDM